MILIKRSRSLLLILALLLGSVGVVAQDETVTLRWGFWGSPEERATHEEVAEAFMAEFPNIRIETWHQPFGEYFTKLQTLFATRDAAEIPDVMFLIQVPGYAGDGVLEPLDAYIAANDYDLGDYWGGLLESASLDGAIYGFPRDIGLEVLYYNTDIFDEAGLSYPDETWTWADLETAAEALTLRGGGGRIIRHGLAMEGGKYQLFVGQNGGTILDDMVNPTRCTLTEETARGGIAFLSRMMNNGVAMRDANLSQAGGDTAVFLSGQAAMIIQNASRTVSFNGAGINYDVAPIPLPFDGQRSAAAAGAAWTMSALSDNKDAAWTFISWLQSTNGGQRIYTQTGQILPALRSTALSDAFLGNPNPPANRQAFIIEGESSRVGRIGLFAAWNELNASIIQPNLQRIWAGESDVDAVLPGLCQQIDAFLVDRGFGS